MCGFSSFTVPFNVRIRVNTGPCTLQLVARHTTASKYTAARARVNAVHLAPMILACDGDIYDGLHLRHGAHAWGRAPHGRVRPDVMCVEKGSEMILWVWSIGVLSYIPRVAYHLPNAY